LPNLESVSIASSRTYHPFTGADQAATAQVRAMVEPNKGKLRSVAARPMFDDIIRHTAPPEGVNFREGAVGGLSAWWAEPEGAATGCEHLRFSARPPLGCRALLSAPFAAKSPPPACPAVPPRSAVLPSIVPSGGSALMFQRNSFYARGGTVSAIRQKCALLISKKGVPAVCRFPGLHRYRYRSVDFSKSPQSRSYEAGRKRPSAWNDATTGHGQRNISSALTSERVVREIRPSTPQLPGGAAVGRRE
jgi:hypothetical protein